MEMHPQLRLTPVPRRSSLLSKGTHLPTVSPHLALPISLVFICLGECGIKRVVQGVGNCLRILLSVSAQQIAKAIVRGRQEFGRELKVIYQTFVIRRVPRCDVDNTLLAETFHQASLIVPLKRANSV